MWLFVWWDESAGGRENVGDPESETDNIDESDDDLYYGDMQENDAELKKLFNEDDNEGGNDFSGF